MGNLALPCGSLTPLMPTNHFAFVLLFFTAIKTYLNPSNMSKNF